MRLSAALTVALGATSALAGCPYAGAAADDKMIPRKSLYAKRDTPSVPAPVMKRNSSGTAAGKQGVFYMNRIGPSGSQLYVANADGSNATALMSNQSIPFDYHANWSPDGQWIVFTSERRGDGQSDLYRVRPDGTGLETLVQTDSFEDSGVLSPDGTQLVYVSTAINYTANLFIMDLATGVSTNLTGSDETVGNFASPHGFFRPSWSPDGAWIAFSSDRNTDWTGHSNGTGWEHTQQLSIYVMRPNGSDFRQVISSLGYSLGTPKWSGDGTRIVYNNMTVENTYNAHSGFAENSTASQIFTVDVATGTHVVQLTNGDSLDLAGQFIGNSSSIGYLTKGGPGGDLGINYTAVDGTHVSFSNSFIRNPCWSPDGSKVVYEIPNWTQRAAERPLWSWDSEWEYRFMDVFPQLNNVTGRLAITQKQLGNSSAIATTPEYTDLVDLLDAYAVYNDSDWASNIADGGAGAFQPTWNPDGTQIAVGMGNWFVGRNYGPGTIYLADANGTWFSNITDNANQTLNAGFPSFSPDGTRVVYRLWSVTTESPLGLYILDLETGNTTQLTDGWDNTPGWSPDGLLIVFTRQTNWTTAYGSRWYSDRYDVCTIRPDGSDLRVLTTSAANDAHAVWSHDGRIMYNSGMYGFRDECAIYDNTFQPYGQIVIMNADGSNKTMLTDSMWEDSMPLFVPNDYL